jgi:hypothetical protein
MEPVELEQDPPFEINEPVEVGDLSDVQAQILPVCQNVKGLIKKASIATNKDRTLKYIKLELQLVDGIPVPNEDGDVEYRFRGKTVFPGMMETCIWADPNVKTSNYFKTKQHLLPFKEFVKAMGVEGKITVNDIFLGLLINQHILFSIKHEANTFPDENGVRKPDGTFRERIYGWKKAPEE